MHSRHLIKSLAPLIAATLVAATLSTLALVALLRLPTSDPHHDLKHFAILVLGAHAIARHHERRQPVHSLIQYRNEPEAVG